MTGDQTLVYSLFTDQSSRDEVAKPMVSEFLTAHGVDPMRFPTGNNIDVRRHEDGSLWVHTWQVVPEGDEKFPLCESCPSCVKQERVVLPLAARVPIVVGVTV